MVMPDHSGRRVGGFELIEPLASGGFATVYRARQVRLDRDVAVKVLDPSLARDPDIAARFEREGRAAASLDHPNVVPVYEAGEDDGLVYLAMRLVPGETLDDFLLRGGPISPNRTARYIEPVAKALDHAHERGLIHRDVKPSNIFIEGDRIWLGDFGIAATADQVGRYTTGTLGTAHYMAPEQASQGELDGRADLYALGCVVHRCLTGRPPYDRGELVATLVAHVNEPIPETGDPALDRFLDMALAKEPGGRFARGADMVAALRSVGPIDLDAIQAATTSDGATGLSPSTPAPPTSARASEPELAGPPPDSGPEPPPPASPISAGAGSADPPADPVLPPPVVAVPPPSPPAPDASGVSPDAATGQPQPAFVAATTAPQAPKVAVDESLAGGQRSGGAGRRALLVVAAIVVLGASLGGAWFLFFRDGGESTGVGDADEREISIGEPIAVGDLPRAVTIGGDSVFVANVASRTVSEVPTGGGVVAEEVPIEAEPIDIHGAGELVWVTTDDPTRTVLQFDLSSNNFAPIDLGFVASRVAGDDDGAWVTDRDGGRVVHLDRNGSVTGEVEVDGAPGDLVLAGGSLWVSDTGENTVVQIDPEAEAVVATIPLDISVGAITASEDVVFVTDRDGGTVTRFPMAEPTATRTERVAVRPTRPEVGAGGLWLVSPESGRLHRYDVDSLAEIQEVDVGGTVGGLAIDGDDLWVTRSDSGAVVRVTTAP